MSASHARAAPQPLWFLALYALAVSGGAVAYVPLLTVLLPLKIAAMTGSEDVPTLARVTFAGAIIASVANIAFGALSDRYGPRIFWIACGLILSTFLLLAIDFAQTVTQVIALVVAWQIGLNMMLAPLLAYAGDCFPDEQKGTLGGVLALAPAMGALAGSVVTLEALVSPAMRLPLVALLVLALVLPAIVLGRRQSRAALLLPPVSTPAAAPLAKTVRSATIRLWSARFLVQIAEAGLFAFLLFWLRSIQDGFHENTAANIFSLVLVAAVPLSFGLGRWSDRTARPMAPLVASALVAAAGLVAMALAGTIRAALGGYIVFGIAATVFLSLHTGQTLRVLAKPQHRGRDLGIFNLTNTVPSIVMPWLTLALVPGFGYAGLFVCFALLALLAALMLATVAKPMAGP